MNCLFLFVNVHLRHLIMSVKVHATKLHVLVTRLDILLPVKSFRELVN